MNKTSKNDEETSSFTTNRTVPAPSLQAARQSNIEALVAYYKSGIKKPGTPVELGIELEHIIVKNDLSPVSYSEPHGMAWLLGELGQYFPSPILDKEGDLLGAKRDNSAVVTLEPAAQVELSAGPFAYLEDAKKAFTTFEDQLAQLLNPVGSKALTQGYHPSAQALDLELIPKRRYQFMNLYLGERSIFGPRMMRGSASTQVSIDYYSVSDCLRKLRLSYALVPIFSLISDNAAIFEGKPRTHQLIRTEIWQECDPDRCGIVPDVMSPSFTLEDYAAYVLDTPAILCQCKKAEWCYSEKTFGEIFANRTMTRAEVEHAVSMLFNDVRLKTYLEIRPADSMPIPYVIAYTGLIKGLFYNEASLAALDKLFVGVSNRDIVKGQNALMKQGYHASLYGQPVADLADELIELAKQGLSETERPYLSPLAELISQRATLADKAERKRLVKH